MPFFSIIVPVYNIEKYIVRCIDSILHQSFTDFELIIVNDETLDRSIDKVKQFRDHRIKIINKENGGLSSARNCGLASALGDYIWFIDGDDFISNTNALTLIFNLIKKYKKPLDIIVFNNLVVFEEKSAKGWINRNVTSKTSLNSGIEYVKNNAILPINAWTQCYKKAFLTENHFTFYEGIYYEDIFFNLDVYQKASRVAGIDEIFIHYMKREGSIMMQKFTIKHLYSEVLVFNKFTSLWKKNIFDKDYLTERINYEYFFLKRIYSSIYDDTHLKRKYIKNLDFPIIPKKKNDSYTTIIEKKLFKYKPFFVLEYLSIFERLSFYENKIKRFFYNARINNFQI